MKLYFLLFILLIGSYANALTIEDTLSDAKQEEIAKQLFQEIRCVVCSGQSIGDSRAELAGNLRQIIRGKISQGYNSEQIKEYLVVSYGESILMKPPVNPSTYLLWLGPLLVMCTGGGIMVAYLRSNNRKYGGKSII